MVRHLLHTRNNTVQTFFLKKRPDTDAYATRQQIFAAWAHAHTITDRLREEAGTIEGTAEGEGPLVAVLNPSFP